jgi:anti-anti-sigma regulatory factor
MIESQGVAWSTRIRHNLVVTIPSDIGAHTLSAVQSRTLDSIKNSRTSSVIFDCSAIRFLDLDEFEELRRVASMAQALGATPYIVGLRPDIVILVVNAGVDVSGIRAFPGLEEALNHLEAGAIHATHF